MRWSIKEISVMQEMKRKKNELKKLAERKCGWCGTEFQPVRKWQEFCKSICRFKRWDKNHPRTLLENIK